MEEKSLNLKPDNGLVKKAAIFLSVGIYSRTTVPLSISKRIKWYLMSMCFDLWWCTGFSANAMAPWLSAYNLTDYFS